MKILHEGRAIVMGIEDINPYDFPYLRVIGTTTTGLDHLPLSVIKEKGIKLISLRDFPRHMKYITSTAEHTFGLILALMRHYKTALSSPYKDREEYKGHTLSGKTLGIIGYGRVGKQMKKIAEGFGMNVLTYDIYEDYKFRWCHGWKICKKSSIEQLLRKSDIISIHIPLDGNEGFFTEPMFGLMKSSAHFINTSRSKVIQEGALLNALQTGKIAGAAVDFIDDEALVEYAKTHDNLILTNHIGGMTFEDRERTDGLITRAVENFINDKKV